MISSRRPEVCPERVAAGVGRFTCCALGLLLSGCDGAGEGAEEVLGSSGGQVTPPWTDHCLATFTEDHQVYDSFFDEVTLNVLSGDAYLLKELGDSDATIYHLSAAGPVDFDIEEEGGSLPFTTNCSDGSWESALAVFVDVTLYVDEALTEEVCALDAGTITSGIVSYQLVSELFGDVAVYEIGFPTLPELCPGVDVAFVEAALVTILDVEYTALPIGEFLTPAP